MAQDAPRVGGGGATAAAGDARLLGRDDEARWTTAQMPMLRAAR